MKRIRRKIIITLLSGVLVISNALPAFAEPGMQEQAFPSESGSPTMGNPGTERVMDNNFGTPPEKPEGNDGMMPGDMVPPEMQEGNEGNMPEIGCPPGVNGGKDNSRPGNGTPPEKPEEGSLSRNGTPPEKPEGNNGLPPRDETPPERPDGDSVSHNGAPPEKPDGNMRPHLGMPSENGLPPRMSENDDISGNDIPPERPDDEMHPSGNAPGEMPGKDGVSSNNAVVKQKLDISSYFPDSTVKYKVSPKGSAKVNSKGIVKVKKAGEITVTGYDSNGEETGTYSFTADKPVIRKKMRKAPGEMVSANEFISGTEASPTSFSSSNEAVATVDNKGNISVLKNGSAKITATFGTGSGAAKYTMRLKVKTDA